MSTPTDTVDITKKEDKFSRFFLLSVLQGLDDQSCQGLKHLLLGAIQKCLGNIKDAVQVCFTLNDLHYKAICVLIVCLLVNLTYLEQTIFSTKHLNIFGV